MYLQIYRGLQFAKRHLAEDCTIIMSKTLRITGNRVMYDRISKDNHVKFARFVLPAVCKFLHV